jgi:hypothetical protein
MRAKTVELPAILRAADGHALYATGEDSVCLYHGLCAYTGTEPDRCPECHSLIDEDGICAHTELPPNRKNPCLCVACLELFTSLTAFDKHQRNGKCRNPIKCGLVLVDQGGWILWGNPGAPPPRDD